MFKDNNKNTRGTSMTFCQVFIVNFKHFTPLPIVFIVDFEQLNVICGKVHCVKDYLFQTNILIADTILSLDYRLRFCEKLTSTSKGVFRTPGNICKLKCFAIIFNGFSFLIFIAKLFILDLCCSPSYGSSIPGQFNWKFKNIKRSDTLFKNIWLAWNTLNFGQIIFAVTEKRN